jgi:hypothetical protein
MTKIEVLQQCTVDGNVVKLPSFQLERKLYQEVAKSLELIGGKWKGGKVFGFVFQSDPTELLEQIANGEKRNLKKEFQFFATPEKLADYLVELADISGFDTILEPSAGQGAIISAIWRQLPGQLVFCCELMETNRIFLHKMGVDVDCVAYDFLEYKPRFLFNRIIANPPFSKNQDIDHVLKMYECLCPTGRLVSIMSESWVNGNQKKQVEFRKWIYEVGAEVIDIPKGSFKESGTMVGGVIVIINKKRK